MDLPPQDRVRWLVTEERAAFYESLAPEAKARFLDALQVAADRGLDEEAAWAEGVVAAETAYSFEDADVLRAR
jgi:hypothetical protein